MLFYGAGVSLVSGVFVVVFVSLFEAPVVGEPGGAGVLAKVGLLVIVGVEFVSIASIDQHFVLSSRLCCVWIGVQGV